MNENFKITFKNLVNSLNLHVASSNFKYIQDMEEILKTFFSSKYVKFWRYDKTNETLILLDGHVGKVISLESSLTKQAIKNQASTFMNHISSNKYYNPDIDNPLELKIKSLIIVPIIKGKQVLGVLKIGRGIKEKKVFTKQDQAILQKLMAIFIKVMLSESMDKDEIMNFIVKGGASKANNSKNENLPDVHKKNKKEHEVVTPVSKKIDNELQEQKAVLAQYKEKEIKLKAEITQSQHDFKILEKKYKELKSSLDEAESHKKEYQKSIKNLEIEVNNLAKKNSTLKNEKAEKSLFNHSSNMIKIDQNIECLLPTFDNVFSENEYSYMLVELMLYALYSKKGLTKIEEMVKKSKLLPEIIESYDFRSDVKIHREKHILSKLLNNIEQYEKNIFLGQPKISVTLNKNVPVSLVFDRPKVQSIVFHLLIDLYQFINHTKEVAIEFKLENKFLIIEIGGFIHTQNSLFKSMFKKTKLRDDDKDRLGLQVSRKLIEKLKGTIEIIYKDEYYQFVIMFPVQFVKM